MGEAVVGAVIGAASAAAQAQAAAKLNRQNRAFADYQRRTRFQVERQDLELAGYNPLYAFYQGGSGASGYNPSTFLPNADIAGHIGKGVSSGLAAQKQPVELAAIASQTGMNSAAAKLAGAKISTEKTQQTLNANNAKRSSTENKLLEFGIPAAAAAAKTQAAIERSGFGEATRWIKRALDTANPASRTFNRLPNRGK